MLELNLQVAARYNALFSHQAIALTSPDGALAALAAVELQVVASVPVMTLVGGTQAWARAGLLSRWGQPK